MEVCRSVLKKENAEDNPHRFFCDMDEYIFLVTLKSVCMRETTFEGIRGCLIEDFCYPHPITKYNLAIYRNQDGNIVYWGRFKEPYGKDLEICFRKREKKEK